MTLRQKEALFQIPISNFENFIKNGMNNFAGEFKNNNVQAAYNASVYKSIELTDNLSTLLLVDFNSVDTNLNALIGEINNINLRISNIERK